MAKVERAALAFVVALAMCASCDSSTVGGSGGETHWLDDCDVDGDCGGSLSCRCGVCTRGCRGDGDCRAGASAATCFTAASPGVVRRCGSDVAGDAPGICLNVCSSGADCPAGKDCVGGRCETAVGEGGTTMPEPGEPGGPMPESGPPPVAPSPNDTAGKYVGVDSGVDFETPVAPAEPRLQIEGSLEVERLVGTWMEVEADGSRCKTDKLPAIGAGICARLELGTGGAGVGGTIAWQRLTDSALDEGISGPFEPPSDASRGYPQGVGPELYGRLIGAVPRVPYRMLDGTYSEGRLSFWYSPVDLWQEWCALQTPFPYDQYGRKGYRCVPPGATEENAELGPLVLCTSQWDFGTCAERVPCVCQDSSASPLCKPAAMCNCTSAGCAPAVRAFVVKMSIEVDVEAGVMTAVRSFLGKDDRFVLKKVTP